MPPKKPSLSAALQEATRPAAPEPAPASVSAGLSEPAPSRQPVPPSRQGKKAITGHFDPAVSRLLRQIALEEDRSVQDLMREALNDLFAKRGKPTIAA
jgi:hypothetical protein